MADHPAIGKGAANGPLGVFLERFQAIRSTNPGGSMPHHLRVPEPGPDLVQTAQVARGLKSMPDDGRVKDLKEAGLFPEIINSLPVAPDQLFALLIHTIHSGFWRAWVISRIRENTSTPI